MTAPVACGRCDRRDPPTRRPRARIVREGVTVGIATGAYGISFGAIAVAAGLDVWQTCALSLLVFTGASQFALVGVVASGGAPLSGAATALLLGLRNGLYGLRLAPMLGWTGLAARGGRAPRHRRVDGDGGQPRDRSSRPGPGSSAPACRCSCCWNLPTLVGALAGPSIGDPRDYGLDAAVGGAFLALLWPRLRDRTNQVVAVLAVARGARAGPAHPGRLPGARRRAGRPGGRLVDRRPDPTEVPGPTTCDGRAPP